MAMETSNHKPRGNEPDNKQTEKFEFRDLRESLPTKLIITRARKATSLKSGSFFFLSSKFASTDWSRNNKRDVASRRKLAPRRRGRVVRALDSRPESPEFGSHYQQFEIQGQAL